MGIAHLVNASLCWADAVPNLMLLNRKLLELRDKSFFKTHHGIYHHFVHVRPLLFVKISAFSNCLLYSACALAFQSLPFQGISESLFNFPFKCYYSIKDIFVFPQNLSLYRYKFLQWLGVCLCCNKMLGRGFQHLFQPIPLGEELSWHEDRS